MAGFAREWRASTGESVRFKGVLQKLGRVGGTDTYEEWTAPSARAAKEYLNTRSISEIRYYLVVQTPEGNWGKDVLGVYQEGLAATAYPRWMSVKQTEGRSAMFCPSCGKDNIQGARFCTSCGNALAAGQTSAGGGANKPDARVREALDAMGMKYTLDPQSNFLLIFDLGGGRHQHVVVNSSTEEYLGHQVRRVYSIAQELAGPLSADLANKLLEETFQSKFGAWAKQGNVLVYLCTIEASSRKENLRGVMELAAHAADQMEARLSPAKDKW